MVSETEGSFFKSKFLKPWTKLTNCIFKFLSISGTLELMIFSSKKGSGKGMYKCKQRLLRASPISLVLFDVRNTIGLTFPFIVPISGIDT